MASFKRRKSSSLPNVWPPDMQQYTKEQIQNILQAKKSITSQRSNAPQSNMSVTKQQKQSVPKSKKSITSQQSNLLQSNKPKQNSPQSSLLHRKMSKSTMEYISETQSTIPEINIPQPNVPEANKTLQNMQVVKDTQSNTSDEFMSRLNLQQTATTHTHTQEAIEAQSIYLPNETIAQYVTQLTNMAKSSMAVGAESRRKTQCPRKPRPHPTAVNARKARHEALRYVSPARIREWHAMRGCPEVTGAAHAWTAPSEHSGSQYSRCKQHSGTVRPQHVTNDFTAQEAAGVAELYLHMMERACEKKQKRKKYSKRDYCSMSHHLSIAIHEKDDNMSENTQSLHPKCNIPSLFENMQAVDRHAKMRLYMAAWNAQPPPTHPYRESAESARELIRQKFRVPEKIVTRKKKVFCINNFTIPSDKARLRLKQHVNDTLRRYKLPWHGAYHDVHEEDIKHRITGN